MRLEEINNPSRFDLSPEAVAAQIKHLPLQHESYADALMLAQLIISDSGFSIRGNDGMAILPSIIIDMAKVFEAYLRRVLADHLGGSLTVWDGNTAAPAGAKTVLFDPVEPGVKNAPVTPDIVIKENDVARLIIDAKYKPVSKKPDRNDINQIVLYGARYDTEQIMLLHPGRAPAVPAVTQLGKIGPYDVYYGRIDLNAANIEDEEKLLANAIGELLK